MDKPALTEKMRAYLAAQGAKGGARGGHRWSAEEGRKAALKRWEKRIADGHGKDRGSQKH